MNEERRRKLPMTTSKPLRQRLLLRAQRVHLLRKLIRFVPFFRRNPQKWVFIVGCYNSGTTILEQLLSFVPGFTGLPTEGANLTDELPVPELYGWTRMWTKCVSKVEFSHEIDFSKADKIRKSWYPFYSASGHVFLEKSVSNVPRMGWLDLNFSNCYFIGITRDPYAVVEGITRKARPKPPVSEVYGDNYPVELAANQWLVSLERMRAESSVVSNYFELTYESLIQEPEDTITKLLNFLGEPSPEMSMTNGLFSLGEGTERLENQNSASLSRLSAADFQSINQTLMQMQLKYGYEEKTSGEDS